MTISSPMTTACLDDSDLVRESLSGNRDAFARIVTRYQTLVCSLAYSATGNLSRSEDLAQETFITAWRQLAELRDPSRLRPWLCGIARNLISNAQRKAGREPAHLAGPIEADCEPAVSEPSPSEAAISSEEATLLWRALGGIPELYREPLVLFYREQQSVARVAAELELTEDAVKQRLARGRALLQERVASLVEGTLERSGPGRRFAIDVMSALPLSAAGLSTASLGAATGKGGPGVKATLAASSIGPWGLIAALSGLVGGVVGYAMGDEAASSQEERRSGARFWKGLALGCGAVILPAFALLILRHRFPESAGIREAWLGLYYALTVVLFGAWVWRYHRRARDRAAGAAGAGAPSVQAPRQRLPLLWVGLVTGAMSLLLAFLFYDASGRAQLIQPDGVAALLARHPDAKAVLMRYQDGRESLYLHVPDGNRSLRYLTRYDDTAKAALTQSGRMPRIAVQGQDFELFGWAGRYLFILCSFIVAAGITILLREAWRRTVRRAG